MDEDEKKKLDDLAFRENVGRFLPNLIFFGIGFAICWLLAGTAVRFVAVIGFVLFAAFAMFLVLRAISIVGMGGFLLVAGAATKEHDTIVKSWVTTLVILLEAAIYVAFAVLLYLRLWGEWP